MRDTNGKRRLDNKRIINRTKKAKSNRNITHSSHNINKLPSNMVLQMMRQCILCKQKYYDPDPTKIYCEHCRIHRKNIGEINESSYIL